jgi:hypothetical protein
MVLEKTSVRLTQSQMLAPLTRQLDKSQPCSLNVIVK